MFGVMTKQNMEPIKQMYPCTTALLFHIQNRMKTIRDQTDDDIK